MRITYLDHSGFAAELENRLYLFDDINKEPQGIGPARQPLRNYDRVYFFVSHEHADHFNFRIFDYADCAEYFLAPGVKAPARANCHVLDAGESYSDEVLEVRAFGSTDLGVSFLVTDRASGRRLFHAGDLNCWHWTGEWSAREEQEARDAYERELGRLTPEVMGVDAAFLPVDPRMQGDYDAGACIFAERFLPKSIIPMHCWGKYEILRKFRDKMKDFDVFAYSRKGESREYPDE